MKRDVHLSVDLIVILMRDDKKDEAIVELRKILAHLGSFPFPALLGREEMVLFCEDNLGHIYFESENYTESASRFDVSLEIKIKMFGYNHPVTGVGYFNCGKSH